MSAWTTELPKESGFYWWRRPDDERHWPGAIPHEVVYVLADTKQFMPHGLDYFTNAIRGEFWPERLTPPLP